MRHIACGKIAIVGTMIAAMTTAALADNPANYEPPFTPAWAAPTLQVFPEIGPPGSTIEIRGSRFHGAVAVYFGSQPMAIVESGRHFIVAVVPPVRGTNFIYVVDPTGRARSYAPFTVSSRR